MESTPAPESNQRKKGSFHPAETKLQSVIELQSSRFQSSRAPRTNPAISEKIDNSNLDITLTQIYNYTLQKGVYAYSILT